MSICQEDHDQILADPNATKDELRSIIAELQAERAPYVGDIKGLALRFHDTYERLAPSFGYETRHDTKKFEPESPNGKLMCAVVSEFLAAYTEGQEPVGKVLLNSAGQVWIIWKGETDIIDYVGQQLFTAPPLPEPKQEPVATKNEKGLTLHAGWDDLPPETKLYAAPPEPAPECKHEFVTTFGGDYCIKCNVPAPKETALSEYKRLEVEHETTDPIERLRAFCSLAMDGQDWIDVEPFFDAITKPAPQEPDINSMRPKPAPVACTAPSSDEVAQMVEELRCESERESRAANMLECLSSENTRLYTDLGSQCCRNAELIGLLAARVPDGCVVVQRKVTEDGRCALATPGNYRTYQDQWNALIAAGEVKTC